MKKESNNLISTTIGIPAYNEESNIENLLSDIKSQICKLVNIDKVIIVSDGSIDNTVNIIKRFKNLPIQIIDNKERRGVGKCQNQISQNSNSEILVILNADIRIPDNEFIEKLVSPILKRDADLVSAKFEEVRTVGGFEEVLHISMIMKRIAFEKYRYGNNLYTCAGVARALSRKFYKDIYFKTSIGEDAYSYLFCVANNYKYAYNRSATIYYKLPENMKDHRKQSARFVKSKEKNIGFFGKELVDQEYKIPLQILLYALVKVAVRHPIKVFIYLIVYFYLKIKNMNSSNIKDAWEVSISSKNYSL